MRIGVLLLRTDFADNVQSPSALSENIPSKDRTPEVSTWLWAVVAGLSPSLAALRVVIAPGALER